MKVIAINRGSLQDDYLVLSLCRVNRPDDVHPATVTMPFTTDVPGPDGALSFGGGGGSGGNSFCPSMFAILRINFIRTATFSLHKELVQRQLTGGAPMASPLLHVLAHEVPHG
jgi:hypothetical protein